MKGAFLSGFMGAVGLVGFLSLSNHLDLPWQFVFMILLSYSYLFSLVILNDSKGSKK